MKIFGVQNHLPLEICQSVEEAHRKGFIYTSPEYSGIEITKAVVVKGGMESGGASVDLILQDASGKKFVCMITGGLLKMAVATLD